MTKETVKEAINMILENNPELTDFGFEGQHRQKYAHNRKLIWKNKQHILKAYIWITANLKKQRIINTRSTSYGLKHIAEREVGYLTNGAFITAMILAGFRLKTDDVHTPNACFNVTRTSIKDADDRVERLKSIRNLIDVDHTYPSDF